MKFKQFIKDNIKRISTVILCIVLMFSMTITTLAFEGEIEGLDKEILEEYIENSDVFFNPQDLPVYSPFNHTTLYYIMKWPVTPDGWEVSKTEYVSLTTESGGLYYTYYLIPERDTSKLASFFINWWCGYEFPDFYFRLFVNNTELSSDGKYLNAIEGYNDAIDRGMSIVSGSMADYMLGYVYCTVRSSDNTLLSVSELYYGDYDKCLNYLPTTNITQVYYNSSHDLTLASTSQPKYDSFSPVSVKTKNLNNLVSVSTYSITAYDTFGDDSTLTSLVSSSLSFSYALYQGKMNSTGERYYPVPEIMKGPNFPSGVSNLSFNAEKTTYPYFNYEYLQTDRPYLIIPSYSSSSSNERSFYTFVFPENTTPLIYFRSYVYSYNLYFQVLSKVDYELYQGTTLVGTFDAETTTYTCINAPYDARVSTCAVYSSATGGKFTSGNDYVVYPHLAIGRNSGFSLACVRGYNSTFSIFPDKAGTLGFYTFISPNIIGEVISGNSGEVGGNIFDNIGGGGSVGPDIFFDDDFFMELNKSEVFDLDLPPYPDASGIFNVDFSDIWLIPERIIEYLILVIDWISTSFEIFIDKIGGPIEKYFLIMRVIFEKMPDIFRFGFILLIFTLLGLRLLQYGSSSINIVSNNVSSSYSRYSRDKRRSKAKGKNKSAEKNTKKGGDD